MLHIAPEPTLEKKFRALIGKRYLTADLYEDSVDVKMDITDIKYKDNSFDFVICNHVLEHIDNDIKAMSELRRVQKKNGWSILLVPVADMPKTYEDFSIKSKEGRFKAFGQEDHVRKYGADYVNRLKEAGYKVKVYKARDIASRSQIKKMALIEDSSGWGFIPSELYFCTK